MAAITASMVGELRAKTDAPMMECKRALTEAEGDMARAEEILRVKLGSKASKAAARITAEGDNRRIAFEVPRELAKYVARKGSVAVDGVSLTVNAVEDCTFEVNLIPHTLAHTNLGVLAVGARVNIEVDTLARYAERLSQFKD